MTDLLLITDVPRLRNIFNRLADDKGIMLRTASSLEKGGEELITRKPTMVFVQTHLSGLSADILLMHLKKQLGRKRSRFVLLCDPSQVSADTIKRYQGHIDISLEDEKALLDAIRRMVADLTTPQKGRSGLEAALAVEDIVATSAIAQAPPLATQPPESEAAEPEREPAPIPDILAIAAPFTAPAEPSLEEQGITYAPRSRVKVYSEFTNSFDNAVESMQEPEPRAEPVRHAFTAWDVEHLETVEPKKRLSKRSSFLLWLAPVLVAAVVVTVLQNRKPEEKPVDVISVKPPQQAKAALPAQPPTAAVPQPPAAAQKPAVSPAHPAAVASPKTGGDTTPQLSDKAILSDIAGERSRKETHAPARPSRLPDFIPRYAMDKQYSAANPGWERYKGQVTEFKVFREKESIRAIQVIDRGGQGVPESFMNSALRQVVKTPAFVLESSEKKDGYEIQRGRIADNLKVVYYRDEQGGRLRAFVMTWQ